MTTEPLQNTFPAVLPPKPAKRQPSSRNGRCLSCGKRLIKPSRRYCTKECRQQINWVLSLSKGLLKTFNARYAAFSFTRSHVILDILPVWSKDISRFISERLPCNKPAEDFKGLIVQWGREWHHLVNNRTSGSYATLHLLQNNRQKDLDSANIKPSRRNRPRLSKYQNDCLKILKLQRGDLASDGLAFRVKTAYKRLAKRYHPDMGGDAEKFRQLNEAHKQMLLWTENPRFICRKALHDCWTYDSSTNRWAPPL